MVSTLLAAPQAAGQEPDVAAAWAEELALAFARVALFSIDGTQARLRTLHGVPRAAGTRADPAYVPPMSLIEQTPLRWTVEAASPVIGAGRSPGGALIAQHLGLSIPRAFAVFPLVEAGKLVALAYVDQDDDPLPLPVLGVWLERYADAGGRPVPPRPPAQLGVPVDELELADYAPLPWLPPEPAPAPRPPRAAVPLSPPEAQSAHEALLDDEIVPAPPRVPVERPKPKPENTARPRASEDAEEDKRRRAVLMAATASVPRFTPPKPRPRPARPAPRPARAPAPRTTVAAAVAGPAAMPQPALAPVRQPSYEAVVAKLVDEERTGDMAAAVATPVAATLPPAAPDAAPTAPKPRFEWPKLALRRVHKVLITLATTTAVAAASFYAVLPPARTTSQRVDVPAATAVGNIAASLESARVIRSSAAFLLLARLMGVERSLRAGAYNIEPGLWPWQVLDRLHKGQVDTLKITVPEGLTVREVADLLEKSGIVTAGEFIAASKDAEVLKRLNIPGKSVEGFLFPETYTVARGVQAVTLIEAMVKAFFARVRVLPGAQGLSRDELYDKVILASLVEREARDMREQPRIAGVFTNRLNQGMRLESCASVQYILGAPKERLQIEDVRTPSPYNTYLHPGLPPGPICSPGVGALDAALRPEENDFLFFFALDDGSRRHHFSRTYGEHMRAHRQLVSRR